MKTSKFTFLKSKTKIDYSIQFFPTGKPFRHPYLSVNYTCQPVIYQITRTITEGSSTVAGTRYAWGRDGHAETAAAVQTEEERKKRRCLPSKHLHIALRTSARTNTDTAVNFLGGAARDQLPVIYILLRALLVPLLTYAIVFLRP